MEGIGGQKGIKDATMEKQDGQNRHRSRNKRERRQGKEAVNEGRTMKGT